MLFKIKFTAPQKDVLKKIIHSKIDVLTNEQVNEIVNRFQLTGGDIELIATKATMAEVLNNEIPSFEQILAFCNSERATNVVRPKVGFA